jgi:uncharacterized membrane protein (DUF441 family)
MELPSWAMAGIRTAVQAGVGFVLAWLATKGITLDAVALEGVLFALVTGLAAAGLRLIERHAPWMTRVLSLGLSARKPVYVEPPTTIATA